MTERMLPPGGSRMREDTRDRYLHWDQGLPRIEELTPLNQTLITPVLACAFSIKEGGMLPERTEADVERSAQATLANLYANSRLGNKSEYPAGSQYQQYAHRVDGDSRAFYGGANVHAYGGPAHGSPSYSQPYEASGPLPAYPSHRSFSRGLQEPQALSDPRYANPRYSSELRHSSDTRLAEPPPHHVDNRYSDPRKNDSRLMDPRLSNQRYPPERGTYMGGSVAGYAHARNFHERAPLTSVDPRVAHGDSRQMDPRGQLDPQDLRLHVDLRPSFESLLSPRGEGQSTGDVRPTDLRLGSEARGGERGGGGSGGGGGGGNQYGAVAELRGQESLPMQDSPQQGDVRGGGGDSCGGDAYGNGAGPAAGEPTTDSMRTGYGALERRPGMDLGDMEGSKGGTEQEGGGSGPRDGSGNQMSKKAPRKSAEADEYQEVSGGQENSNEDGQPRTLKRPRLVWTPQLHKRFVDAVGHLGIKNAVPKTIMQLMNVEGLTRENVASHLQKYRLYLKRMQGLSSEGPSASDHLFASTPMPPPLASPPSHPLYMGSRRDDGPQRHHAQQQQQQQQHQHHQQQHQQQHPHHQHQQQQHSHPHPGHGHGRHHGEHGGHGAHGHGHGHGHGRRGASPDSMQAAHSMYSQYESHPYNSSQHQLMQPSSPQGMAHARDFMMESQAAAPRSPPQQVLSLFPSSGS